MTTPVPELPDLCWPVIVPTEHAEAWEALDEQVRDVAVARATLLLHRLTGYRVGGCPVTVRPARVGCSESTWQTFPTGGGGTSWTPRLHSGVWINVGGPGSGSQVPGVDLPGEPSSVSAVRVDGVELDPSEYLLMGNTLYRTNGKAWPATQHLERPDTEEGTFSITYTPGIAVDGLGAVAAGLLAWEFSQEATTGACKVPANVTNLTRAGVSMDLTPVSPGEFDRTGIDLVDEWIARWNPHRHVAASRVYSPDMVGGGRQQYGMSGGGFTTGGPGNGLDGGSA